MRLRFGVLVEGRIEVETKFRIGETDRQLRVAYPALWPEGGLCHGLVRGHHWLRVCLQRIEAARGTVRNAGASPAEQTGGSPGPCLGTGSPPGGQACGWMMTSRQGARGGEAGSKLQERVSGQIWKHPETNMGM